MASDINRNARDGVDEWASGIGFVGGVDLAELKRDAKETYSFGIAAIGNGKELIEHSQLAWEQLEDWQCMLVKWMDADSESLRHVLKLRGQMGKNMEDIDALVMQTQVVQTRYNSLSETLEDLKRVPVPVWTNSSVIENPKRSSDNQASEEVKEPTLCDFVDEKEISALLQVLMENQDRIKQFRHKIDNRNTQLSAEDHSVYEELVRIFPSLNLSTGTRQDEINTKEKSDQTVEGKASVCADDGFALSLSRLDSWMNRVKELMDVQKQAMGSMAKGSAALAALQEYIIRTETRAKEDADGMTRISLADISAQPFYKETMGFLFQNEEAESKRQNLLGLLRSHALAEFKRNLKQIAGSLETINKLSILMLHAKQQYITTIGTAVAAMVNVARSSAVDASSWVIKARQIADETCNRSKEFTKLEEIYGNCVIASEQAKCEIERRWQALGTLEEMAKRFQNELDIGLDKEMQERKKFQERFGKYLPNDFCPALESTMKPSSFLVLLNSLDAQMLRDCIDRLNISVDKPNDNSTEHPDPG